MEGTGGFRRIYGCSGETQEVLVAFLVYCRVSLGVSGTLEGISGSLSVWWRKVVSFLGYFRESQGGFLGCSSVFFLRFASLRFVRNISGDLWSFLGVLRSVPEVY